MMPQTLTIEALNHANPAEFATALGNIFEHSPWIAEATAKARPFADLAALRQTMLDVIARATPDQRLKLIRAHPDLANKTQRAQGLTDESTSEQDGAGLDRLSEQEFRMFEELNGAYKAKFGFPFIICVRRHTKDSILDRFAERLAHAPAQEEEAALAEIGRIGTLRLAELVATDRPLAVHGRLSTHVLDTHGGIPAAGMAFELIELARHGGSRTLSKGVTNADGRTDRPLVGGRPVPIGTYELRFHTAAYFETRGLAQGSPPFLDVIPLRFGVAEPEGHYHVPLLLTPWSYSTYRGS